MPNLTSADNQKVTIDCIGCALVHKEIEPIGGFVLETNYFTLSQDYEVPISGFMIIGAKRHFRKFSDMNSDEEMDFLQMLKRARLAMEEALGIESVTVIQEEKSQISHFHVWLFPWYAWMEEVGRGLPAIKKIMEHAEDSMKNEKNIAHIRGDMEKMKAYFSSK